MTEDEEFNADEKVRIAALHKTAPKKIWLQIDPEAKQFDGWDAQTWCSDQINDTDLEYARVDVVESLCQQLAAALAACKLKDEALKDEYDYHCANYDEPNENLAKALAVQPDDSALKAWIGEPVAWLHENRPEADVITDAVKNVWTGVVVGKDSVYSIPLYAPKWRTK